MTVSWRFIACWSCSMRRGRLTNGKGGRGTWSLVASSGSVGDVIMARRSISSPGKSGLSTSATPFISFLPENLLVEHYTMTRVDILIVIKSLLPYPHATELRYCSTHWSAESSVIDDTDR